MEKPLSAQWVELGTLLSVDGKHLKIGLPQSESAARDGIMRGPMKKSLEEIAQSIIGRPVMLEVTLDPNLKAPVIEPPPPPPAPEPPPAAAAPVEAAPAAPAAVVNEKEQALIQGAITKFKAKLLAS